MGTPPKVPRVTGYRRERGETAQEGKGMIRRPLDHPRVDEADRDAVIPARADVAHAA